jgi:phosphoribosylanthranilate isomerase
MTAQQTDHATRPVKIKICGLTDPDQARACAELGADAIGFVFFPKSPRHLTRDLARAISRALPPETHRVGVFVDAPEATLIDLIDAVGLTAVQLHGRETPDLIRRIQQHGTQVIKGLFAARPPYLKDAHRYPADAILAECGAGKLPGGNAETWDWSTARAIAQTRPLILAGGLTPENVARAIAQARPWAVDVSSGVESAPGQKDLQKVAAFIQAATRS